MMVVMTRAVLEDVVASAGFLAVFLSVAFLMAALPLLAVVLVTMTAARRRRCRRRLVMGFMVTA